MQKLKINLHLLGPQGSGKGTQSEILAKKLNFKHISVGDLLRKRATVKDDFAKDLKRKLDAGELVSDEIVKGLLEKAINQHQDFQGYIFDGTLRNLNQTKFLHSFWSETGLEEPFLIVLEIADDEAIKRISKRRVCPKCNFITFTVDEDQLICPKCGTQMIRRSDDTTEAIQNRLKIYHNNTEPVIAYFQSLQRAIAVDGHPSIEVVSESILQELKKYNIISL